MNWDILAVVMSWMGCGILTIGLIRHEFARYYKYLGYRPGDRAFEVVLFLFGPFGLAAGLIRQTLRGNFGWTLRIPSRD